MIVAIRLHNEQIDGSPTDDWHHLIKNIVHSQGRDVGLAKLHSILAGILLLEGRFDRALAEVDAAEKADSQDPSYEYLRAEIYDAERKPEMSSATRSQIENRVANLRKREPISGSIKNVTFLQEELLVPLDDDEDSIERTNEAILLLEPLSIKAELRAADHLVLGLAYCANDRIKECRVEIESSYRLDSTLRTGLSEHKLGILLKKKHDAAGALLHFQQAYEMEPQNLTYRMDYETAR